MRGLRFGKLGLAAILAALLLSGCAEKARTVAAGAQAFEQEGLKTVALLDDMRQREVAAPAPDSPQEAERKVAAKVLAGSGTITADGFRSLVEILRPGPPPGDAAWTAYLDGLRARYQAFGAAFTNLEEGSLFARDAVPQAVPVLDRLTADALAIADHVQANPPLFLAEREDIAFQMMVIRDDATMTEAQKTSALTAQAARLSDVLTAERDAQAEIAAQAARTAAVAQTLRPALANYGTLSLQDVSEAVAFAFSTVSGITGRDYSAVLARLKAYRDDLVSDPDRKALLEASLAELSRHLSDS